MMILHLHYVWIHTCECNNSLFSLSSCVFFVCVLSQLINLVIKMKKLLGISFFSPYSGVTLQKTASTFEGVIAVTLKQGVIIPQMKPFTVPISVLLPNVLHILPISTE